jgi:hypothetical protein
MTSAAAMHAVVVFESMFGNTEAVAAIDARVHAPVPGSAAKKAQRRLQRLGLRLVAPPTTSWVGGTPGPLLDGEVARARRWGEDLAAAAFETEHAVRS